MFIDRRNWPISIYENLPTTRNKFLHHLFSHTRSQGLFGLGWHFVSPPPPREWVGHEDSHVSETRPLLDRHLPDNYHLATMPRRERHIPAASNSIVLSSFIRFGVISVNPFVNFVPWKDSFHTTLRLCEVCGVVQVGRIPNGGWSLELKG